MINMEIGLESKGSGGKKTVNAKSNQKATPNSEAIVQRELVIFDREADNGKGKKEECPGMVRLGEESKRQVRLGERSKRQ